MDGWIFRDWRDDICLVYGKTYARVRTAEVRRSINRPLLKSHVNGTRVYPAHAHAVRTHTHRVYTRTRSEHRANPREKFARAFLSTFCEREPRGFHNSLSIPAIDSVHSLSFSFSLSIWIRLMSPGFYCFALGSIDLPSIAYFRVDLLLRLF